MTVSKTNQILINRIKKQIAKYVKNPKALTTFNAAIAKIEEKNSKLKEVYRIIKNYGSPQLNTLSKLITHDKHTKQIGLIEKKSQPQLAQFNSFQSPEQAKAVYQSLKLLPKNARIKNINAEYKKKHIVSIFVDKEITRENLQKLGDKISKNFKAQGIHGSIGIAVKYDETWRGSYFVDFGENVRLHTNADSDESFDESHFKGYEIYYMETSAKARVGTSNYNDCFFNCLKIVYGDHIQWQTPESFKKVFHIPRYDKFPLSKIPLVEKALKNVAINVSGDYLYNSAVNSLKRINMTVSKEHITLAKEMTSYNKQVSYKERKPIIYDRATFNAYDGNKIYQMPLNELYDHYDWKTDYIIINYVPKVIVNKERVTQSMKEAYERFIEEADKLKEITIGKINLFKTGNDKTTALHLFESLTKHIETPPKLKQNEANEIQKASMGAIIFNTKEYVGTYHKYDIKSDYPSIMKSGMLFPAREGEFMQVNEEDFNTMKMTFFKYGIYRCHIPFNAKFKKLFRFNDNNRYTHIDLTRAVQLKMDIEIIIDDQANLLHYSRDKLLSGSEIFGSYIGYCFDLKEKKAPKSKSILNVLWGALSQKKIKKHINDNSNPIVISDTDILHGIKPFNDHKTIFEVSKMTSQYKSGWARIAPFLLAKGRVKISSLIEPYQDICIRCHTDSMNLIEQPPDIKLGDKIGDLVYEGKFN